jgi:hypothetical protein
MYGRAKTSFQTALRVEPRYRLAQEALDQLSRLIN